MDGVTQTLSEDGLARVWRQAKQEEAGLSGREAVDGLKEMIREKSLLFVLLIGVRSCEHACCTVLAMTSPYQP